MPGSHRTALVALTLALCACGGNGASSLSGLPVTNELNDQQRLDAIRLGKKVKHVVIIIQENRSFDNLFQGFPGADTRPYGYDSNGKKITLQPVGLEANWDMDHSSYGFFQACDGQGSYPGTNCKMNGFNLESCTPASNCPADPQYSYVPHTESAPYFSMAKQYVLADRMFPSNFDASSFISHQYIIAGQASSTLDYPVADWGCEGGPSDTIHYFKSREQIPAGSVQACFNNTTLGDELDTAGLSWRFSTGAIYGDGGIWSGYQAIQHIYQGPDWSKDIIYPQTKFFSDVSSGALPVVSWVTPTRENSDHPGYDSNTGPSWVASLVNAIGESKYWNSTVIFIFWDDYGGWYDHVPPRLVDYDGLGIRVPLLIISAYAKKGYVSHEPYEHGSILKFIEDRFKLPAMAASDKRALSPEAFCFDFSKPPRAFKPIKAPYDKDYFLRQPIDYNPPDDK
jgi:phospholipase C